MTNEPNEPTEAPTEAVEAEAPAAEAPIAEPGPLRIRIGPVRMFTACTILAPGCKAREMGMGNVFPVGLHTSNLQKPLALACSSCLTKMQRDQKWVVE